MINEISFKDVFKSRLRYYMNMNRLSQADLAKLSGVSPASIGRYLDGTRTASAYCVAKLAKALNCTVSDLTGY